VILRRADDSTTHLLLVDIGNSRVSVARWCGGTREAARHVAAAPVEAVADLLGQEWDIMGPAPQRAAAICSVSPPLLEQLRSICRQRGIGPLLVIGEDIEPPIGADLPEPHLVGKDRLCAAAAAYSSLKAACVVADFGTALTIDLVSDNGVFLGGTILPGMALSAKALHEHTALLPLIEIGPPTGTLGKDTRTAIRNGIFAMMVGALREVSERYASEIGKWPPLVVTGGDAEMIAPHCDFVDRVLPDLCLDGIALAYELSQDRDADE
jgi:type III pantothenate kinase